MIREEFLSGKYSKVVIFYNFFVNTIKQIPVVSHDLPISANEIKQYLLSVLEEGFDIEELKTDVTSSYELEPTPTELAENVIPMILDMMFFDTLLNAKASEHSARMIAMKNAKDAAHKISSALTLRYNKARQAGITNEVSEITS
jgi:F-type H+-transporting ATPase subunit gamma